MIDREYVVAENKAYDNLVKKGIGLENWIETWRNDYEEV